MHINLSRRNLQIIIAIAGFVPVGAGLAGIIMGPHFVGQTDATSGMTSHFAYLSGLLLAIGLIFWASIPRIEGHAGRVRLLTLIVVIGGLGRVVGAVLHGVPGPSMLFGMTMELIVTPLICWWQARIAI